MLILGYPALASATSPMSTTVDQRVTSARERMLTVERVYANQDYAPPLATTATISSALTLLQSFV